MDLQRAATHQHLLPHLKGSARPLEAQGCVLQGSLAASQLLAVASPPSRLAPSTQQLSQPALFPARARARPAAPLRTAVAVSADAADAAACISRGAGVPLVKMCGMTSVADAVAAVEAGAAMVGLILWPGSKRSVTWDTARAIAAAVQERGAEPVAVFVDEDSTAIEAACAATAIQVAQLHGDAARAALPELPSSRRVIYVVHADSNGQIVTPLPDLQPGSQREKVEWVLVDGLQSGSGEAYDWSNLEPPVSLSTQGWLLAGGLNPGNVAEAVRVCRPHAVDVASGVAGPDKVKKDPARMLAFMAALRHIKDSALLHCLLS